MSALQWFAREDLLRVHHGELPARVLHRNDFAPGTPRLAAQERVDIESFCARYRVHRLVYFEKYSDPITAINREKKVKRLTRAEKIALIEAMNPKWRDLTKDGVSR